MTSWENQPEGVEQLITAARAGSAAALDALLVLLSDLLKEQLKTRRLYGMSPSRSNQDFVQDTVIRVHERFSDFPGGTLADLTRWSWKILYQRHQQTRRNRRTRDSDRVKWKIWQALAARKDLPNGERPRKPADAVESREEAVRAYALFKQRLTPAERNIIQLRVLDGLPYDEIASNVGKSGEAVRIACRRALANLKRLLECEEAS